MTWFVERGEKGVIVSESVNLTGLAPLIGNAFAREEATIAFSLKEGLGQFAFLIFVPTGPDGKILHEKLELCLLLCRTKTVIGPMKLYGSHRNGDYKVFVGKAEEESFKRELGIENLEPPRPFSIKAFLETLHTKFPTECPLSMTISTIQTNLDLVKQIQKEFIDDTEKVYFLGFRPLAPNKKPREETLRKLYVLPCDPKKLAAVVSTLKQSNTTVAWTNSKPQSRNAIKERFNKLFSILK